VIDGGQCIPYPGTAGINWQHFLYGFNNMAFCHLTVTDAWPLSTLSFVVFTGFTQPGQVVTARLCVHAYDLTVTCGSPGTISGGAGIGAVGVVYPPALLPPLTHGAFVQFNFPSNSVSGIIELLPYWYN
jgi:hypothetical protein